MELITVFETLNPIDLSIAKSILEEENILYFPKNEFLRNAVTYFGLTPVEIQVAEKDVPAALELLETLIKGETTEANSIPNAEENITEDTEDGED